MVFMVPIITFVVLFNLPAALGLYWIVSTVVSVYEQRKLLTKTK
jgi:membrane protein insertase Oxa1/YidC/SpoIIIJ